MEKNYKIEPFIIREITISKNLVKATEIIFGIVKSITDKPVLVGNQRISGLCENVVMVIAKGGDINGTTFEIFNIEFDKI